MSKSCSLNSTPIGLTAKSTSRPPSANVLKFYIYKSGTLISVIHFTGLF
nr:MAG TPA: hypothetical protein [Caudoviricetes sp.]